MRQPISEIERLTHSEIAAYLRVLGELIEAENGKGGGRHEENYL